MEQSRMLKRICDDTNLLVATAESVTVGHLQSMIAAVSGASTFFRGGITAYSIEQKVGLLGVDRAHAERVDCVSSQVAAEMAFGATRLFGAQIGLATTGYAEPSDISNISAAFAFYAIWDNTEPRSNPVRSGRLISNTTDRVKNQRFYAEQALHELVAYLSSSRGIQEEYQDVLRIERLPSGGYRLGQRVIDDISQLDGALTAVKRPIPITVLQVNQRFEVVTTEGTMQGKQGDWLLQGVAGEVYICPDDVFKRSYDYPL